MDIDLLKTFLEVSKTRHFGKAAKNLFLTQSAVSARIRQLEEELEVTLFSRERNNIQLTKSGERLVGHAELILASWERARSDVELDKTSQVKLVIAGVPSIWDVYLNRWIRRTIKNNPEVALSCDSYMAETVQRRILDRSVDIGFTYESPQYPEIEIAKTIHIDLIMVSSKRDLQVCDAIMQDYVFVDWGSTFTANHAIFFPDMPPPRLRLSLGRVARDFIKNVGGSAYLAESMVRSDLEKQRLHRVVDAPSISRTVYAIHRIDNSHLQLLSDLLK